MIRWLLSKLTDRMNGLARAYAWPELKREVLVEHPDCVWCGQPATTVHHKLPYHLYPEKELDKNNLASVCGDCHFVQSHLKHWDSYRKSHDAKARAFRKEVEERP